MCGNCLENHRNVYQIQYNDFGDCYVIAESFEEAERLFRTKHSIEQYTIKGIVRHSQQIID